MDRTNYLSKKHPSLKEQAFQYLQTSKGQYPESEYRTPTMMTARPRTRSTNTVDKHVDMIRHPPHHEYGSTRTGYIPENRYSAGHRLGASQEGLHKNSGDPALRVPIPGRLPSPMLERKSMQSDSVLRRREASPGNGYRPRPRSIATDVGYTKMYATETGPLSPEYDYRSSTSNLHHHGTTNSYQTRTDGGDVRKWGSCSRLEYNTAAPSHHHYPLPDQERTEGDGGPSSYSAGDHLYHRRHSASKLSNHSGSTHSDDIILAQKAEIDEKNRVIESLRIRMSESESRALSEKSGENGAVAESLDSGIDTRSETGVMRPLYSGQRTVSSDNEIARLRMHIKQLESRMEGGDGGLILDDERLKYDKKISDLSFDLQSLTEEKVSIARKFSRLQDYLTTLPTVKEYNDLKDQLSRLLEENKALQEKTNAAAAKEKTSGPDVKKLQKKCTELKDSVIKLEKQNNILKSQNAAQAKQELQKIEQERSKMEKKIDQLRKEITVLNEQKETTKNLVGGYYEKYSTEQEKTRILKESLDKSVGECTSLKTTLSDRDQEVTLYREQLASCQAQLASAEERLAAAAASPELEHSKLLLSEFQAASEDLAGVVEVVQMSIAGQQPDISLLLGLRTTPPSSARAQGTFQERLTDVKGIRNNIEYLRTQLSDIYAEDVGNRCPTQ